MRNRSPFIYLALLFLLTTPVKAQWVTLASDEEERVEAHSAVFDNKIYLFGGFQTDEALGENQSQETDQTGFYDPVSNTWTKVAPLPLPITHVGTAIVGRKLWMAGGFAVLGFNQAVSLVYIYDVDANTWTQGPSLPAPRSAGTLVRLGRKLHYISGLENRNDGVVDHFVLDLDEPGGPQTWNTLAPIPESSNHLSGIAVGGKIYAIGGQVNHDIDPFDVDFTYEYDPVTNDWTEKASMPIPRSHMEPGTFVVDGKIILVGGKDGTLTCSDRVSSYDPQTDSWSDLFTVPDCLLAPSGKVVNNEIYVSHGGLINVFDPQTTMRKRDFPRSFNDEMDFYPQSVSVNLAQGESAIEESVLFTLSDEANYTINTGNLPSWISSLTATSGVADHAGAEVDVTLDASNLAAGTYSHTLVATASGYQTASFTINLTVSGEGEAVIAVDPSSVDLGSIPLGYTATQDFTISNVGTVTTGIGAVGPGSLIPTGGVDYRYGGEIEETTLDPGEFLIRSLSITPISGAGSVEASDNMDYSVSATTAGTLIARINTGGAAIDEPVLPDWSADIYFDGGQGFQNSLVETVDVPGGTEPSMYLTERSAGINLGTFAYRVPATEAGTYITRLHFAETFFGAPGGSEDFVGRRVFDVNIEGGPIELDEYDIAAEVGPLTGVVKTFVHEVVDGVLDIEFSATVDQPKVTGIEVFKVDPAVHQYFTGGWNLVSLPVTPDVNDYQSIFTDVPLVQQPYGYGSNGYTQTSQLFTGQAYWVESGNESFQAYDGGEVSISTITTETGWNMIGGPSCVFPIDQATAGTGVIAGDVYGYDPENGYVVVDDLVPGKGYWIFSSAGGPIVMNCNTISKSDKSDGNTIKASDQYDQLVIIDVEGRERTLFLSDNPNENVARYMMPPIPFKHQPDVRFNTGSRLSTVENSVVLLQGMRSPLKISIKGRDALLEVKEGYSWQAAGTLIAGTELVIDEQDIESLRILSADEDIPTTPEAFALHGVYPNPFNTAGTLVFDAPKEGAVRVEIFSMLGRRLASFESNVQAGARRSLDVDGASLPAGAYVYRLTLESAGDIEIATGRFIVTK